MEKFRHNLLIRFIKWLNAVLVTVPFGLCWYLYYVQRLASPYHGAGNYLVLVLFFILYCFIGHVYEAFNISTKRISEMIYSQCLAMLASNAIVWIVLWLLMKKCPPVWPMLLVTAGQAVITTIWSVCSHKLYYRIFPARPTAVVYDARQGLDQLISSYGLDKKYNVLMTLGIDECLEDLDALLGMETVFLSGIHSKERNIILKFCMYHDIEVMVIPRVGDVIMSGAKALHMFHLPILQVRRYDATPEYLLIKRIMDLTVSLLGLVILSPVMLAVAIAVKAYDGGPVLYKQVRLTRNGKKFFIHKFRSMRVDAEKDGVARLSTGDKDDRITPVGRVLRKLRLDELPQLFDILSGNLSIVGPRPERPEIAEEYMKELPEFQLRLEAKAGLTGYAQVYGKYNTTPYDKLQMDLMYIAHPSILEDLKIMMATVKILFMADSTEGVEEGHTTAAK